MACLLPFSWKQSWRIDVWNGLQHYLFMCAGISFFVVFVDFDFLFAAFSRTLLLEKRCSDVDGMMGKGKKLMILQHVRCHHRRVRTMGPSVACNCIWIWHSVRVHYHYRMSVSRFVSHSCGVCSGAAKNEIAENVKCTKLEEMMSEVRAIGNTAPLLRFEHDKIRFLLFRSVRNALVSFRFSCEHDTTCSSMFLRRHVWIAVWFVD